MPQETLNLKHINLPSAWDAAELTRLKLADGTTYDEMVQDIDDALTIASQQLTAGYYGRLLDITDEPRVEYDEGNIRGFERITERGRGQGRRGDTTGHMLPLVGFDYNLYWTYLYLRQARRRTLDRQINGLIDNVKNLFAQEVLTRLFKMEEDTGHYFGLGDGGVSVPFCDGGAGTTPFTPTPNPERAAAFAATHDHYLRLNGITQANLEVAVLHLWEHGEDGPYELVVSQFDVGAWTNTTTVTGYVEKPDPAIAYGDNQDLARVEDIYIGGIKTEYGFCRLYASGRIPSGYWAITKTYGSLNPNNPLLVRVEMGKSLGAELVVEGVGTYPLQGAIPLIFFGVGINRRTGAVLVKNDTVGDYNTPTIT